MNQNRREKESPAIDSATIENNPRAFKEEYELAGPLGFLA